VKAASPSCSLKVYPVLLSFKCDLRALGVSPHTSWYAVVPGIQKLASFATEPPHHQCRANLPSCVRNSSRNLGPVTHRTFVLSPCLTLCLCCPEHCSCPGTRKRRRVLRSIAFDSTDSVVRMRLQLSLLVLLRPLILTRTNPYFRCVNVRGRSGEANRSCR
jgi:hypothetical protein